MAAEDCLVWIPSVFGHVIARLFYLQFFGCFDKVDWFSLIWKSFILLAKSFFCWQLFYGKPLVDEVLKSRGFTLVFQLCVFVGTE